MDRKWRRRSVESVCKERVRAQNCKEVARNWESKWRIGSILSPKYFVQDSYNLSQRVYSTRKCARKIFSSLSNNGYFTEFFEYNEEQRGDEREKMVGETRNLNQVRYVKFEESACFGEKILSSPFLGNTRSRQPCPSTEYRKQAILRRFNGSKQWLNL